MATHAADPTGPASRAWSGVAGGAGNDDLHAVLAAQRDASDGFLVGRDTSTSMRESWGRMTDDTTRVADHLNRVAEYVVSTTMAAVPQRRVAAALPHRLEPGSRARVPRWGRLAPWPTPHRATARS